MSVFLLALAVPVVIFLVVLLRWLAEPVQLAASRATNQPKCTFIDDVVTGPEFPREPSIFMSLVVPAYNENERMPIMLDETIEYFKGRPNASKEVVEIIVVDDGSKDDTAKIASQYGAKLNAKFKASSGGGIVLRVLKVSPNCGKGNAVKQGMLRARGELCLMVDADGASRISDLVLLEKGIKDCTTDDGHGISVGSRAHLADAAIAQRSFIRNILMHGFHALVWTLTVRGIRDTQCGFKLFTFNTKRLLFKHQRIERWCFDPEILMIARWLSIPISEQPIHWQEIEGSKIRPSAIANMGRDLFLIRLCYTFGIWTVVKARTDKTD